MEYFSGLLKFQIIFFSFSFFFFFFFFGGGVLEILGAGDTDSMENRKSGDEFPLK